MPRPQKGLARLEGAERSHLEGGDIEGPVNEDPGDSL